MSGFVLQMVAGASELCYNLAMAKPPTSVRSIRLTDELWAALQAKADHQGVSLNRYVAMQLEGGGRKVVDVVPVAVSRATVSLPPSHKMSESKPSTLKLRVDTYPNWMRPNAKGPKT